MSDSQKRDPTGAPPAWDSIDREWEVDSPSAATPVKSAPAGLGPGLAGAPARAPSDEILPALEGGADGEQPAEDEWASKQETVRRLGLARDLPVVPPVTGERRVVKTMMGVGDPEIQSMFKARLGGAPPRPAVPAFAAPVGEPVPARPGPASGAGAPPSAGAPPRARPPETGASPPPPRGPSAESDQALGKTAPMPVMTVELPAGEAATVPAVSAQVPVTIEPRTVKFRPGSPPRATPTAATHGVSSGRSSGPSNWVLIALWVVALLSVGLAIVLYLR